MKFLLIGDISAKFIYDIIRECSVLIISRRSVKQTQTSIITTTKTYELLYGTLPTSFWFKTNIIITPKQRSWKESCCFSLEVIKSLARRINPFTK